MLFLSTLVVLLAFQDAAPFPVTPVQTKEGETLWRETGCLACHERNGIPDLEQRLEVRTLAEFLAQDAAAFPDFPHRFGLDAKEALALSVWLLREQWVAGDPGGLQPGLVWDCFELKIEDEGLPDLAGLTAAASGWTDAIDVAERTRDDHFLLRFRASLQVPESGEWNFRLSSDDSSWLWLDGVKVIVNEALAPTHSAMVTLPLVAGPHVLEVRMTEAEGGEHLKLEWQGPGFAQFAAIPPESFSVSRPVLKPPKNPQVPVAPSFPSSIPSGSDPVTNRLAGAGCLSCHSRNSQGGLSEIARQQFVGVEDLGSEGRLPPALDQVGRRLRPEWIQNHLRGERRARPYLRARCVELTAEQAKSWADFLQRFDQRPRDGGEPPFSPEAVAKGQALAGMRGKNCIACHSVGGLEGPGIPGMDLALQHERLQPTWFQEWLATPTTHRPGTRMPSFWPRANPEARAEQAALRTWMSLGAAMPLPEGLVAAPGAYVLEASDRPTLHGGVLVDLSARCLAVGSVQRTHYAWDFEHIQLAWIWRGEFLDVEGTWRGRNLLPLEPLGEDHLVLQGGFPFQVLADGPDTRKLLGWRLDEEGWPTIRIQIGPVEVQDTTRARYESGGSILVRTLRALGGAVAVDLPGAPGLRLTPALPFVLQDGESREVIYRW